MRYMLGKRLFNTILLVIAVLITDVLHADEDMTKKMIDAEAYKKVVQSISPLSTDQIKDIRKVFNEVNRASTYTGGTPPTPLTSSVVVDLATGSTPPVIRLSAGYVTTVVFVDSSGEPWPIKAYDIGNPNNFNIAWNQSTAGDAGDTMLNTLMIQSLTQYKDGNLAVMLRGMNTPVIFTLVPGQEVVDYRVDVQVPRLGPNASRNTISTLPSPANPLLVDILNNMAPAKAVKKSVKGGDAKVWGFGKMLYVRTPMTVISPAWVSKMVGADGNMHAYELPEASVILAMDNGRLVRLNLGGK